VQDKVEANGVSFASGNIIGRAIPSRRRMFWHPWSGACVFDLKRLSEDPSAMEQNAVFSSNFEIDGAALLGNNHLVVSSTADDPVEGRQANDLGPKQLGVWSLVDHRWKSKSNLTDPSGTIMPWKEWLVSFYDHPKLIELSTGRIVHRWDHIFPAGRSAQSR
jgi:hypothetical protein